MQRWGVGGGGVGGGGGASLLQTDRCGSEQGLRPLPPVTVSCPHIQDQSGGPAPGAGGAMGWGRPSTWKARGPPTPFRALVPEQLRLLQTRPGWCPLRTGRAEPQPPPLCRGQKGLPCLHSGPLILGSTAGSADLAQDGKQSQGGNAGTQRHLLAVQPLGRVAGPGAGASAHTAGRGGRLGQETARRARNPPESSARRKLFE